MSPRRPPRRLKSTSRGPMLPKTKPASMSSARKAPPPASCASPRSAPASPATLAPEAYVVTLENDAATGITGSGVWYRSTALPGYSGADYLEDGNAGKGKNLRFAPALNTAGTYRVYLRYTSASNRAKNV